jgi:ABC-type glycerol-3-phosphate transport system substrate-binding protein
MRRVFAAIAALLLSALALTGCGGSSSSSTGGDLQTKKIAITITGDSVTPSGQEFDVAVGQPVQFDVTADKPGEIHVHSSPEQEFEYDAGSSTIDLKPIKAPGVVTVESHTLEKTILKLKVQ